MKWDHAQYVETPDVSAFEGRAFFVSSRNRATAGPVLTTGQTVKPAGLPPLVLTSAMRIDHAEYRQTMQEGALLARQYALIKTIRKLRRDHKATSSAKADLQDVVRQLLAMGEPG